MLRAGLLGLVFLGLGRCHAQDLLAPGRETVLVLEGQVAGLDIQFSDQLLQLLCGDFVLPKDSGCHALLLHGQALEKMLGAGIVLSAVPGCQMGKTEHLFCAVSIIIFHELIYLSYSS